jgi:hypothetical protein
MMTASGEVVEDYGHVGLSLRKGRTNSIHGLAASVALIA